MKLFIATLCLFIHSITFAKDYEIKVHGMVCSFCVQGIEKHLSEIPGLKNIKVNLDSKKITFSSQESIQKKSVESKIKNAGYKLVNFKELKYEKMDE